MRSMKEVSGFSLEALKRNDAGAWRTFLTAINSSLRYVTARSRDPEAAAHTAVERFYRSVSRGNITDETGLKSYIGTTARNIVLDEARRGTKVPISPTDQIDTVADMVNVTATSGEETFLAERNEAQEELLDRLGVTNPDQRRMLLLLAEGLTYEEISERTGIKLGTVRSGINRGRGHAKQNLDNPDNNDLVIDARQRMADQKE